MSAVEPAALVGSWELMIRTPIGRLPVLLDLAHDGADLSGTATSRDECVPLRDLHAEPTPEGVRLRWRQAVTRPMRLELGFDVVVSGSELRGESRAGRLPRSPVTGHKSP